MRVIQSKFTKTTPKNFKPGGTHLAHWSWICFLHSGNDLLRRAVYLQILQFFVSIIIKIFQVILNNSQHICHIKYHFMFPSDYKSGIFNFHEKMTVETSNTEQCSQNDTPCSPMFCMAKSLFYSGTPQNHSNKNLK